jgi:CRISPR-associated endonuclease/helicase Cas3
MPDFVIDFESITGKPPFPWQSALYDRFLAGEFPESAAIPTGLGKTFVIAAWLIALARRGKGVPRRLAYVVNRRTVVDQATREAENIRDRLETVEKAKDLAAGLRRLCSVAPADGEPPLAISTLRGQFADNGDWCGDPARPAVVVGTVDMIGSRLLFSGYGLGFKRRPLHAGFLGQDCLLVHDEAHLEKPFQDLLTEIRREQTSGRCRDFHDRGFRVMELTATTRSEAPSFGLTDADRKHPVVEERLRAVKRLDAGHRADDDKSVPAEVAKLAAVHRDSGRAVLVFVRTIDALNTVRGELEKRHKVPAAGISTLTGTMRGLERGRQADPRLEGGDPVFARFLKQPEPAEPNGKWKVTPRPGTVYLLCTSAGEVGVDISADHLVCDLSTFEGMAQRFGRVNRYGLRDDTRIDVVAPEKFDDKDELSPARRATLDILTKLGGDASPSALSALPAAERTAAFSPPPAVPPVSDILFDAWALTTVREPLPGRPPVADWLHGLSDREPPETHVAWRQEVSVIWPKKGGKLRVLSDSERRHLGTLASDLLEDYPLKPHELLRDRTDRVVRELESIIARHPERPVWVMDDDGRVEAELLRELLPDDRKRATAALAGRTVLLPPEVGGLSGGMLKGAAEPPQEAATLDVADEWFDEQDRRRRVRIWPDKPDEAERTREMRRVRVIDLKPEADDAEAAGDPGAADAGRFLEFWVRPGSADDEGSRSAAGEQELDEHNRAAGEFAEAIAGKLELPAAVGQAVVFAARHHDDGKARKVWQLGIGNRDLSRPLAKSGKRLPPTELSGYRHEFGSLLDVRADAAFGRLPEEARELTLHLIAAHHGRARPHFPAEEAFDPERADGVSREAAAEVPRRFARLQRRYGRWGLAYLESLVRAADILASRGLPADGGKGGGR